MSSILEKRIVIPGGGGFLGTHLARVLEDRGILRRNLFVPRTQDGVDFRDRATCLEYLKSVRPQLVINCAAIQGGVGYHEGRQADLFLDNVLMGLFLMEAAMLAGAEKFVNVVAGCSYPGYLKKGELSEEDYWNGELHDSIFSYGFSRKTSVVYGKALKRQYNFNSIHLICANMYGPGEHFLPEQSKALAALLRKFYEAKRDKLPYVDVWGTGRPVRDWLFVKDGAEAIVRATERYEGEAPLNIASGAGVSVAELAAIIKNIVGYEGEIRFDPTKPEGALKKTFNVTKMKAALGWTSPTSLEDGIRETLKWFSANYEHASAR